MNPPMYQIVQGILAIVDGDEELTDEESKKLAEFEMSFEQKAEAVMKYRQSLLSDANGINEEVMRLKERMDALNRKADWMRQYVKTSMEQLGLSKLSTLTFSATLAKSPLSVRTEDGINVPAEYQKTKVIVDLDKTKILEDFKLGKELPPGVTVVQNTHLRIK